MKNFLHSIFCIVLFFAFHLNAQTTNADFEATIPGVYTTSNAVSGWTISSQANTTGGCNTSTVWTPGSSEFSIITTPLSIPNIGTLPNSPLGGSNIARLNNTTANGSVTKLAQTISVTPGSFVLMIAFAGVWEDGGHICCEQSSFKFLIKDQSGNVQSCSSLTAAPSGSNCLATLPSFSVTNNIGWSNWQIKYIDLYPYLNTTITLEIISSDCTHGDHYGSVFIDAKCEPYMGFFGDFPYTSDPSLVNFCAGSNIASINAPFGYASYLWTAPAVYPISLSQATLSSLTITNAVAGSIYTLVTMASGGNCTHTQTYTLSSTTVSIAGIGSSSTCPGGASGSATVVPSGSGTGYNYLWKNSTNLTVGTNSTVSNLANGIYTVNVTASGTQSSTCGNSSSTVSINISPAGVITLLKPFCGSEAYLNYPGGTNYQWYNNVTPITSSLGGTASGYTVTAPVNGNIYSLGYNDQYGCRDSLHITLIPVAPGSISVTSSTICSDATNGSVSISLNPAPGSPAGVNSYSVFSTGTTTAYNATLNPTSANFFTTSGLSAGGTYSVNAFDGSCKYSTNFSVTPFIFNYSVSVSASTLCPGSPAIGAVSFSSPVFSQYTYSWSPSTFLFGVNASNVIISPSIPSGTVAILIYSVTVTPTLVNCPITKTISVTAVNPITPTLLAIPILCIPNSPLFTVTANPPGGSFTPGSIGMNSLGIINPMLATLGNNTFSYNPSSQGTCTLPIISGNYTVASSPFINPLGSQLNICMGQSTTLNVTSSGSYSWSNGVINSSIIVTPSITTSYSVSAMNFINTCSFSAVLTVTVIPTPTVSILSNTLVCFGKTTTITATGANTYTWSNNTFSSFIVISPNANISYTVIGLNSPSCASSSTVINLMVAPNPILSVSGNTAICDGQSTTLLANGADTYTWNNSSVSPFITITPSLTNAYSVEGTNLNTNCSSTKTITVSIIPHPTITISGDTLICLGQSATLTANGANSYNWNNGPPGQTFIVSPNTTSPYSVIGTTSLASCSNMQTILVKVINCTQTGINQWGTNGEINIYPNPTNGKLIIETKNDIQISLHNQMGQVLLEETIQEGNYLIDLSVYVDGIYFLKASHKGETKIIKLVKNN